MFENFPYTNFHDLNMDWLIERIMSAYGPDNPPPIGLVLSVNGETGAVVLYKDQYVRLPGIPEQVWSLFRNADETATGIQFTKNLPMERIDGSNRYKVYDEGNPPPAAAVSSVDGMIGAVKTWANTNQANLETPEEAPGNVWSLSREIANGDKLGIEFEYDSVNQTYKAYLLTTPNGGSTTKTELLTSVVIPQTGVTSVNGLAGIVVLTGTDIAIETGSQDSIKDAIDAKYTKPANGIPASDLAAGVIPDISGKLDAPSQAGTAGQVLTLDNSLNPVWDDPQGGGGGSIIPVISDITLNPGVSADIYANHMVVFGKQITLYFNFSLDSALAANSAINFFTLDPVNYPLLALDYQGFSTSYNFVMSGHDNNANIYAEHVNIVSTSGAFYLNNSSGSTIPALTRFYGSVTLYFD